MSKKSLLVADMPKGTYKTLNEAKKMQTFDEKFLNVMQSKLKVMVKILHNY